MIKVVSGNFFEHQADIRVNTVNCVGVMGKGAALQFKNKFPKMFKDYQEACKLGNVKIGEPHVWIEDQLSIINLPTKNHWRNPSQYDFIESGLIWLKEFLKDHSQKTITLPALGCGNGGLDWNKVKEMIYGHLQELDCNILLFEPESSLIEDKEKESDELLQNGSFHSDINLIFESYLKQEDEPRIAILNTQTDKVVMKMNYDKVVYGHDMTIYKIKSDGTLEKVDNPEFKAVVIKKV